MNVMLETVPLTKTVVEQLQRSSLRDILRGEALCYVVNVRTGFHKVMIVQCDGRLSYLPTDYVFSYQTKGAYRRTKNGQQEMHKVNDPVLFEELASKYDDMKRRAKQAFVLKM